MNRVQRTIPPSQWHKVLMFCEPLVYESANDDVGGVQRFDDTCKWIASIDLNVVGDNQMQSSLMDTNLQNIDENIVHVLHRVLTKARNRKSGSVSSEERDADVKPTPDTLDDDLFKMIFSYDCGAYGSSGLLFVYECDMETVAGDSSVSHAEPPRGESMETGVQGSNMCHMFDTIDIRIENSVVHGSATVTMTVKSVCERARTSNQTKISGRRQCAVNLMQFLVAFARGESWCVCCAAPVENQEEFQKMKTSLRWMHADIDWRFAQAIAPLVRSFLLGSQCVDKFIESAHECAQTVAKRLEDAQLAHDQAEVNRSIRALVGLLADDAESNENTLMLPLSMQRTEAHKIIAILSERFYDAKPPDLLRNSDYGNDNIDYTQVQYAFIKNNHSPTHQHHYDNQQNTTDTAHGCVLSGTVQHI